MSSNLPSGLTIEDAARIEVQALLKKGFQDRDALLTNTVRVLVQEFGCTLLNARLHAAKAIANEDANSTKARIDTAKTTSTCVFLNVDGELRALTVTQLERALNEDVGVGARP